MDAASMELFRVREVGMILFLFYVGIECLKARSSRLVPFWSGLRHWAKYEYTVLHLGNSPGARQGHGDLVEHALAHQRVNIVWQIAEGQCSAVAR